MAEEIENATKQIIVGRSSDGKYITVNVDDSGHPIMKLVGFEIPTYDYIGLSYVAAGDGAGEIKKVIYKTGGAGGTTVATLTLAYNASDEISSITKT